MEKRKMRLQVVGHLFVLMSAITIVGCSSYRDTPYEESLNDVVSNNNTITTLRSATNVLGNEDLYFSVWGKNDGETGDKFEKEILLTKVAKEGDVWKLKEKCVVGEPAFISAVYPATLIQSGRSLLVQESISEEPIYFAFQDLGVMDSRHLNLNFKQLQATLTVQFDLSSFSSSAKIDEVKISPRYYYGWLDLDKGVFNRMNTQEYERPTYSLMVGKKVGEVTTKDGLYKFNYLMLPQKSTNLTIYIVIDGLTHYFSVNFDEVKSNTEYVVSANVFNRSEVVELTPKEKGATDETPIPEVVDDGAFTDYEYTATHQYMQNLSNNSGVAMMFWMDSRITYEENLQYRLLIRDENDKVVSQSRIYSGLTIKPYHYDGFSIPIFLSVSQEGRYKYQLLVKGKSGKWYEPNQKFDDLPKDKYFEVHPRQEVFVSALNVTDNSGKVSSSNITTINYDKTYKSTWWLNNYSSKEEKVTIKVYNRREPYENHSRMDLDVTDTWCDKVGEATFTLSPKKAMKAVIPYSITVRRPSVNRYLPYLCATITYHNPSNTMLVRDKEYPLLADGDMLYRKSYNMINPNLFIGSSMVNNKGTINVE